MNVFLGDDVVLMKGETTISGRIRGLVLNNHTKELERVFIQDIHEEFWMNDGWQFLDMTTEEDDEDEI